MRPRRHPEHHLIGRIGWLRAAVLGANDGILSTASLISGVAAANSAHSAVLVAGIAGLVAGAMSMAAGEYVSVSSQADTENAELARETQELASDIEGERQELAQIYVKRGVEPVLARQVAVQLMAKDALGAHARDELGISEITTARPVQAALTSAATFAAGAAMPLLAVIVSPAGMIIPIVTTVSLRDACRARRASAPGPVERTSGTPRRASYSGAPSPWRSRPQSARWWARKSSGAPEHSRHMPARHPDTSAVFEKFASGEQPGCAVGVICNGELVHAAGYGFADIERGIRIDAGHRVQHCIDLQAVHRLRPAAACP